MVRIRTLARIAHAGAALAVLTLAACAPTLAPQGLAATPPHLAAKAFVTRDGLKLPLREWDAKDPKAIIVALHGMSDYSEAFDMPGPFWAEHGITVFAYDQRGFGAAPDPGIWAGGDLMRRDLSDFVDAVHAKYPGLPVFALGREHGRRRCPVVAGRWPSAAHRRCHSLRPGRVGPRRHAAVVSGRAVARGAHCAVAACLGRGTAYLAVRQHSDAAQTLPRSALSAFGPRRSGLWPRQPHGCGAQGTGPPQAIRRRFCSSTGRRIR